MIAFTSLSSSPNLELQANPAIALRLQSTRPAGRIAELGSLVATLHANK